MADNGNDFSTLVQALGAVPRGDQYVCKCPAHSDDNPSLWFCEKEGKILLHCFAGCSQDSVITALRGAGLWNHPIPVYKQSLPPGIPFFYPPAAVVLKAGGVPGFETQKVYSTHYPYRDLSGRIVGHTVRYQREAKKEIIPFFRWDEQRGAWRAGHEKTDGRLLYNLQSLERLDARILIVEGEKCVDAATKFIQELELNMVAISWPGGSKSVGKCDWSPLKGRDCILWPDLDRPGYFAMRDVAKILLSLSCLVSMVDANALFANKEPGFDIADITLCGDAATGLLNGIIAVTEPSDIIGNAPAGKDRSVRTSPPVSEDSAGSGSVADSSTGDDDGGEVHTDSPNKNFQRLLPFTDLGNGERFSKRFSGRLFFTHERGWFVWERSHWRHDSGDYALHLAGECAIGIADEAKGVKDKSLATAIRRWSQQSQSYNKLLNMTRCAAVRPEISGSFSQFDSDPMILNCLNGTIDLTTGRINPHDKEDYCSFLCPVNFDSAAKCPVWEQFLFDIFAGDISLYEYIQRAIGYSLTGSCGEQVMFILWGLHGQNGKSTFVETLKRLFGTYSLATETNVLLLDTYGNASSGSNSIARLAGSRLVCGSEIPSTARLNESRVKEMTGQDTMSARFLYKEFFDFVPQFKLWLRTNKRPEVSGNDEAIWRRLHTIPFNVVIPPEKRDNKLQEKLCAELPGILNWALAGCLAWQKIGLSAPQTVRDAGTDYRKQMDTLGEFLEDNVVIEKGADVKASTLYECYKTWSKELGEPVRSARWLAFQLRDRGFSRTISRFGRVYSGLRLRNDGMALNVTTEEKVNGELFNETRRTYEDA